MDSQLMVAIQYRPNTKTNLRVSHTSPFPWYSTRPTPCPEQLHSVPVPCLPSEEFQALAD